MTLAAFLAFAGLVIFAAVSPGPAVLMSARTGLTEGFRTGVMLAAGIGTGAVIWALMAMFGLHLVFDAAPSLLWALKIGGAAYLLWMAWHLWRDAKTPFVAEDSRPVPRSPFAAFRLGLWTNLANPKAAVMFSSIFLGTLGPNTPIWVLAALLAIIFAAETTWNSLVARIFSLDRTRARYISLKTVIDRSFGGLLALLGVKIVAT
ncbi:MAG: LysE family translocator [Tabrizicola sp.]|uniref:LysE family translocator n=1 Tax=Tabrizicola sp. TaxID=2005166 RepID=UPI002733FE11|nr:LysE family translocator [Tabrizicola sp.]MDP3264097.1 LysE family translocator [Tabrizicola sp.]MDP3648726.1 LysE family translocator [Paracoccaceae bacterium]MDZ4066419.1 LysE family translocator [Tabrizicola sp.]